MRILTPIIFLLSSTCVWAVDSPISGDVSANCSIYTTTPGEYGNPNPYTLSTAAASGGVDPIVRVDIGAANYYKTKFTYPNSFSSSPSGVTDNLTFTGTVTVSSVSVAGMSVYETNKVSVANTVTYDHTLAGSSWHKITSQATYGSADNTALPAGAYTALVTISCIAK